MLEGLRAGRRKLDGSEYFSPKQTKMEDALHKGAGRFLMQFSILQMQNKCSMMILSLHKAEESQIVDKCQILVYYLNKCGVFWNGLCGGKRCQQLFILRKLI